MRWYHWLFLPFVLLLSAVIGLYIVGRDRYDEWRYRDSD